MDYLQYKILITYSPEVFFSSFKPYYKWITFNMHQEKMKRILIVSFKPYYKWITFNIANGNPEDDPDIKF